MLKTFAQMVFLLSLTAVSRWAIAGEVGGNGGNASETTGKHGGKDNCGGYHTNFPKIEIESWAREVLKEKADCYMKLFDDETSSNPSCYQSRAELPNAPGQGICTLEGNYNLRKERPGGDSCHLPNDQLFGTALSWQPTPEMIKKQMKCCQEILQDPKNGAKYFQGIKSGKLKNCEAGG